MHIEGLVTAPLAKAVVFYGQKCRPFLTFRILTAFVLRCLIISAIIALIVNLKIYLSPAISKEKRVPMRSCF